MPENNYVRKKKAAELRYLQNFLTRLRSVRGSTTFSNAALECERRLPQGRDECWGYSFGGLVFEPEPMKHTLPNTAQNIRIELNGSIVGHCQDAPDPLDALSVQLIVRASEFVDGKQKPLLFAWHFDRHIGQVAPGVVHPRYHFQHAGKVVREAGDLNWGNAIFLEAPRIMHPPMDAILAVDFVLSNFLPNTRARLIGDGNYRKLLHHAQTSLWRPYVSALIAAWDQTSSNHLCYDFWPDLAWETGRKKAMPAPEPQKE